MSKNPGFSKHVLDKTSAIAEQLLKVCLEINVTPANASDTFKELNAYANQLIQLQKKYCALRNLDNVGHDRKRALQHLLSVHSEALKHPLFIKECGDHGFGLASSASLETGSCVLRIPRDAMLGISNHSALAQFISQDPIASGMENVALSLCVLSELINLEKSKWNAYLSALPSSYETFLFMTPKEVEQLKGSPVQVMAVSTYQSICRQYAYFFNRFQSLRLSISRNFCFEDFRWAVSTVMSRNNLIPTGPNLVPKMCLIPIWDMINHKPHHVTTDFDPDSSELIFYTMESYEPEDEIFMDYGKRTNAEFFLFSGFLPDENPHNRLTVTLSISKSDVVGEKRQQLLQLVGLKNPLNSAISTDPSSLKDLVAFARVFVMNKDELEHHLSHSNQAAEAICNAEVNSAQENDRKAIDFLVKRFGLLILMYGKVPEETDEGFSELTAVEKNCARLKREEIKILRASITSLNTIIAEPSDCGIRLDTLSITSEKCGPTSIPNTS